MFDVPKAAALPVTETETASANQAWLYGLELLSGGYFWECHEVLETVWLNAPPNSRERAAVQGVIQLANAALKLKMARVTAAQRLAAMAKANFAEAALSREMLAMNLDPKQVCSAIASVGSDAGQEPIAFWP